MRWLLLLLALPLVLGYQLGDYTEGKDLFIFPGSDVKLVLPFPEGKDCLPVAVLYVRGGDDYPEININGWVVEGGGVHRVVLEGEKVVVTARSSSPAYIEANSLFYCTRDPFVFVKYYPPHPIRVGDYAYMDVVITNYGFTGAEVNLLLSFHPNLSPYLPPPRKIFVPSRSRASHSMFLVSSPIEMRPSAHPRVCISYRDSLGGVLECDGPLPTESILRPRIVCFDGVCYNTSNLTLELNGLSIRPGYALPDGVLDENSSVLFEIVRLGPVEEYRPFEGQTAPLGWLLLAIGLAITGLLSVAFK